MDIDRATRRLGALAHTDRLRIFRHLVGRGPSGEASGRIAAGLGLPPTRTSFHLSSLERSGLLRSWRAGREVRYSADYAAMRALLIFLTEECCEGHPEICGDLTYTARMEGCAAASRSSSEPSRAPETGTGSKDGP